MHDIDFLKGACMDISKKIVSAVIIIMVLSVGCVLAAMPSTSDQSKPSEETKPSVAPKAIFPQLQYQFEPLFEGDDIKHDFIIENHGQAPLVIKKVDTD